MDMNNATLMKTSLQILIDISSRRTSRTYINKVMNRINTVLQQSYPFLSQISFDEHKSDDSVQIAGALDMVTTQKLCEALGSYIRVLFMDLGDDSGLYFLKEFKERAGEDVTSLIQQSGINLYVMEVEQRHVFEHRQEQQKTKIAGDSSLLGYTWDEVSNWKYDELNNVCILYGENDQVLDELNLDAIIEGHIKRLTGADTELEYGDLSKINLDTSENNLLNLFHIRKHSKTIDVVMASALLQMSEDQVEEIIERLVKEDLILYSNVDTITLSEKGELYLSKFFEQNTSP